MVALNCLDLHRVQGQVAMRPFPLRLAWLRALRSFLGQLLPPWQMENAARCCYAFVATGPGVKPQPGHNSPSPTTGLMGRLTPNVVKAMMQKPEI